MHNLIMVAHRYHVEQIRNGEIIWSSDFDNLVVQAGRNKYLDATLKTGLTTPLWYVGLKGTGTIDDGDIMSSHSGWSEVTPYSNATRPAWTPGSIVTGSVDNTASPAEFNITSDFTLYGLFLCDNNTVGGTSGTLLGVGDLASTRDYLIGDVCRARITCEMLYYGS